MGKVGKPRKWKTEKEFERDIDAYLKHCEENGEPPLVVGFAVFSKCDKDTVVQTGKRYPVPYKKLITACEQRLVQGGLTGKYNPTVMIFLAKNNHGYRDKQDVEHSGNISITQLLTELGNESES